MKLIDPRLAASYHEDRKEADAAIEVAQKKVDVLKTVEVEYRKVKRALQCADIDEFHAWSRVKEAEVNVLKIIEARRLILEAGAKSNRNGMDLAIYGPIDKIFRACEDLKLERRVANDISFGEWGLLKVSLWSLIDKTDNDKIVGKVRLIEGNKNGQALIFGVYSRAPKCFLIDEENLQAKIKDDPTWYKRSD